jgi:hypothetical protein
VRYLLLICNDESDTVDGPQAGDDVLAEYAAFNEEMAKSGILRGGERLRPSSDATSLQVRADEVILSDGPFAETKEQIGGYYIVECADLDEAIEVASKIPSARRGTIEVRPIWEM